MLASDAGMCNFLRYQRLAQHFPKICSPLLEPNPFLSSSLEFKSKTTKVTKVHEGRRKSIALGTTDRMGAKLRW